MEGLIAILAVVALASLLGLASPAVRDLRRRQGHMWTLIPDSRQTPTSSSTTASDRSLWTPRNQIVRWLGFGIALLGLGVAIWVIGILIPAVIIGAIGISVLGMGVGAVIENRRLRPRRAVKPRNSQRPAN